MKYGPTTTTGKERKERKKKKGKEKSEQYTAKLISAIL